MKAYTALILASIIVSASLLSLPILAIDEPPVGVKEGDWIEYDITLNGTGKAPPTHDVRWFRMQIIEVQGTAFWVNLTARYANGTVGSSIWDFNFTDGNVGGWVIIPSGLSPGEKFYDSSRHNGKPVNVTVQGQEQREVCGASRVVTFGNDSLRHKEWDMTTGVMIGSIETYMNITNKAGWYINDLTVNIEATATNLWSPQILGLDQNAFYLLVGGIVLLAIIALVLLVVIKRKTIKKPTISTALQGKIAALTVLMVVLFEVATIFTFPFYDVGLSFAEINLIMQTIWLTMVLLSIGFRIRGNYFVHELLMIVVICAWAVGLTAVLFMDPFSTSTDVFASTPMRLVMNALHGIISVPALVFGVWLVVLWRPGSTTFPAKSRRVAQLIPFFWIASYVVGVLDFMMLHTTIFG